MICSDKLKNKIGTNPKFNSKSASLLKEQFTNRQVAPLGHIIQYLLLLLIIVCFVGKKDKYKFHCIWFHPTGIEPTIFSTLTMPQPLLLLWTELGVLCIVYVINCYLQTSSCFLDNFIFYINLSF